MPNPKSGRVVATADLPRAISAAHKCQIEFKLNRTDIIHLPLGKVSFEHDKLMGNLTNNHGSRHKILPQTNPGFNFQLM